MEAAPGRTKTLTGLPGKTVPGAVPLGAARLHAGAAQGPGGSRPGVEGGPLAGVLDAGWVLGQMKVERNQNQDQVLQFPANLARRACSPDYIYLISAAGNLSVKLRINTLAS